MVNARRRFATAAGIVLLSGLGTVAGVLLAGGAALGDGAERRPTLVRPKGLKKLGQSSLAEIRVHHRAFETPTEIRSAGGLLDTTLTVQYAEHDIAGDRVKLRAYNGQLVGPTLRVRPGDTLKVHLKNWLPDESADPCLKAAPAVPRAGKAHGMDNPNIPHGFNHTNLHTHGLHVSPRDPADNVFLDLAPGGTHDFTFEIPRDHLAGTFWYHAHKHGSVALQLASGMAGALIVEGGLDDLPAIRAMREQLLVFQMIPYAPGEGGIQCVHPSDLYSPPDKAKLASLPNPYISTNGVVVPTIEMAPGEIQRWRLIDAGIDVSLKGLRVVKFNDAGTAIVDQLTLREVAADGIAFSKAAERATIDLFPGYRSDILVPMNGREGDVYYLYKGFVAKQDSLRGFDEDEMFLMKILVRGPARTMQYPTDKELAALPHPRPIPPGELANRDYEVVFDIEHGNQFKINGQQFDPTKVSRHVRLGTAEEWSLSSRSDQHPFHIHVNPFAIITTDPTTGSEMQMWKDTLIVKRNQPPIKIRMRFEDHWGPTVLHCHILDHEDQGMMQIIQIDPK